MPAMTDEYWKQEFEKRVAEIRSREAHSVETDHRSSPRYRFAERTIMRVSEPPTPYRLLDISAGGVAILCDHRLEADTRLMLAVKNSVYVEIVVLGCELMESDSATMEFAYKTRCRFQNEQDGLMAFVLLAET
jgi:hypothetical protein